MTWIKFLKLVLRFKKALDDSKVWYPPVCMICRAEWSWKDVEMVQCMNGHIFIQPKHQRAQFDSNLGDHHGDL